MQAAMVMQMRKPKSQQLPMLEVGGISLGMIVHFWSFFPSPPFMEGGREKARWRKVNGLTHLIRIP